MHIQQRGSIETERGPLPANKCVNIVLEVLVMQVLFVLVKQVI